MKLEFAPVRSHVSGARSAGDRSVRCARSAGRLLALVAFAVLAACQGSDDPAGSGVANSSSNAVGGSSTGVANTESTVGTSSSTAGMATTGVGGIGTSVSSTTLGASANVNGTSGEGSGGASAGSTTGSSETGSSVGGSSSGGSTTGGGSGGTGAAGAAAWGCPSGISGTPTLGATPSRIEGVPPADDFNMNNGVWGNIEGPVWIGGALYVSEMTNASYSQTSEDQKMARILKITEDGTVSIFAADSGSNGLAVDAAGDILAGVQKDGSIMRFPLTGAAPSVIVSGYMGMPFNSPNDIAIRSDGTIYFSDPTLNAPSPPPQPQTYVYRLPPGGQVEPIPSASNPEVLVDPNGVTLSLAEDYLYVAAESGRRFPVMADGTLGAGQDFPATSGGDGMAIDCAGNLYVAKADTPNLDVYTPNGDSIGTITLSVLDGEYHGVTNVAFGGPDQKTLYISGHGVNKGLFKIELDIPGRPY